MNNKRKLFAPLCILLVMASLLCACGEKKNDNADTTSNQSVDENNPLISLLPDTDYDSTFVILTREGYNEGQYLVNHEETGDPINAVSVARTVYLEDKYAIDMSVVENENLVTVLNNSHLAGGKEFDLIEPHPTDGITNLMVSGCFANLLEMPYQFTSREWWNQSQVENYTTNGKLYLGVSDLTITGQSLLGLIYNRDRYVSLGFTEDLHDLTMSGGFTMEYLKELLTRCQSSSDGTDEDAAEYGLLFQVESSRRWMYALGQRILTKNSDGVFELSLKKDPLVSLCSAMYGVLYESGDVMVANTGGNKVFAQSDYWTTFESGRALFAAFNIGSNYSLLRELEFDVGYLPLPKLNASQQDYLVVEASALMGLPALAKNGEMSSVILEAMSIWSYQKMRPAFFDTILMGRLSENPDDYEMLEFLHESKFYDFGFTLDSENVALNIISEVVINKKRPDTVAGYLVAKENDLDAITDLANTIQ